MRALLAFALLLVGLPALADPYQRLYQAAGWPDQRAHFSDALDAAQKRYQDKLPPALYQTLVDNSNRRFAPAEVDQRALNGLRENLPDSASPLNFFESPLGRKVVAAEVLATRRDQLLQHSNGLPRQTASEPRRALVKRLAQVLPAREAGAEVSLALAGVAADSLSQMLPGLPGLLGGGQTGQLLEGQRQRLVQQIGADLENTLLYVYRDLSDAELTQYVNFAESPAGRSYYQAALAALKAGLAVDQAVAPDRRGAWNSGPQRVAQEIEIAPPQPLAFVRQVMARLFQQQYPRLVEFLPQHLQAMAPVHRLVGLALHHQGLRARRGARSMRGTQRVSAPTQAVGRVRGCNGSCSRRKSRNCGSLEFSEKRRGTESTKGLSRR